MRFALIAAGIAGCARADAAPAKDAVPCTADAIAQVRKRAEAELRAGHSDAAIALLQPGDCFLEDDQPEALQRQIAWRLSDLSFALFKAGRFADCYAIAGAQTAPYAGDVGHYFAGDGVVSALEHNAKLCKDADHKARGTFTPAAKCTLDGDYGIPPAVLGGAPAACLSQKRGHKDSDNLLVCGGVSLVEKLPTGKIVRKKLSVTDGNLADGSVCCNIDAVSFAKRGATWAVRVHSGGRDCNGGTRSSEEEHEYGLVGATLKLVHALDAAAH